MSEDTATIKARELRPGMVLLPARTVVDVQTAEQGRGMLTVTTDRGETPRAPRTFDVHGGSRVRVTLDSFRTHRSN